MQLVCISIRNKLLLSKHAILMVKVQIYKKGTRYGQDIPVCRIEKKPVKRLNNC